MAQNTNNIITVGAGIGGLTFALAAHQFGYHVRVVEQAPELGEVGAGIQISPNGFFVLEKLGLSQNLNDQSVLANAVVLHDYQRAAPVARLDLQKYGSPTGYRFFHRADLLAVLIDACRARGIEIITNCQMNSLLTDGHISTSQGALQADLIVGADGIHSKCRHFILGDATPAKFTGQVAWRAIVPNIVDQPNEARIYMAPHRHIVTYPIRGGDWLNMVLVQEQSTWSRDGWTIRDDADVVRKTFDDFTGPIAAVLEQIDTVFKWGLFRHPVAPQWYRDRLVILGDAAHPTLPFMAQGAVQAIEDAWVLAQNLANHGIGDAALSTYQTHRLPRVKRVVDTASGNAWKYHLAFGPVRWGAHLAISTLNSVLPARLVRQFDWIYNHDVTLEN